MRLLLVCLIVLTLIGLWNWPSARVTWDIQSARQSLREGAADDALEILRRAELLQPERAELLYLLGRAHRQAGQFELARRYLDRAAHRGWSPEDLRHQQRLAQVQMGQMDQAETYLQELLRGGASDELALEFFQAQAQGLLRSYRLNEALVCLNHWIQWRPQDVQPRLWRGEIWERILRWTDATAEYQTILELDPQNHHARRRLAHSLLELHEFTLASEYFQQSLQAEPHNLEAAIGAAKCERWLSRLDEAIRRLDQVRRRDDELTVEQKAEVYSELGQIALEREEYAEAVRLLKEAVDREPSRAAAHHALGRAYARTGNSELAQSHTEVARRIYAQYGRLSEVTQALIRKPDDADLRWQAGRILLELGLSREGAAWMATALLVDPNHHPTHQSLAEYYAMTGDSRRAAHHYELSQKGGDLSKGSP